MPKHIEIAHVPMDDACRYRFCLDKVLLDDKDPSKTEFAFVSRGTKASKDGFIPRQAYFTWKMLGALLREAIETKRISVEETCEFLDAFCAFQKK